MAIDEVFYLNLTDAVKFHILYMRKIGETRIGVFDKSLIESALARPRQAAAYENADVIRQAATLLFGLIKNHPWQGGNKRTATFLTNIFLKRNGFKMDAPTASIVEMVLAIESDNWKTDEIESWLRQNVKQIAP